MVLDDRQKKHVSFDASSLMRSQTIATMDEQSYQRTQQQQAQAMASGVSMGSQGSMGPMSGVLVPGHSNERLIDTSKSDFLYYSEMLPPDLARQLMLGKDEGISNG